MDKKMIGSYLQQKFGVHKAVNDFVEDCISGLEPHFRKYKTVSEFNFYKVLHAFRACGISNRHFYGTTGYGYSDEGRDKLGELFARIFGAERALVSPLLASGTHAISTALFGLLRPLDTMFSITGRPYDTLCSVIGLDAGKEEPADIGSLRDFAVKYRQAELLDDGQIDMERVLNTLYIDPSIKVAYIQRSRGYELRPALSIRQMGEAITAIKDRYPHVIVVVDNCYGEFTEECEPTEVGADVVIGSLIKNPGAGIAPTGGYIAGTEEAIAQIEGRLTCPGLGAEIGSYLAGYLPYYQGIFLAPNVVYQALCGATLTAEVFARLGYTVYPGVQDIRSDITQTILMKNENELIELVRAVQSASPVDSNVVPYPWDMPGYQDKVIMAAGSFIQGSSIEISADAPIREPYAVYFQGGLTLENVKLALMIALQKMNIIPEILR